MTYRGATLTWQNGRQLVKYQKGSMIAEYKYDGNGNRISKTHNGNTYEFIYNGSNLVAMTNTGTTLFNWICDENGDYLGFTYCGVEYYYIRNLQNDVIGIKNPSGKIVVEYEYDPFGKVIATKGPLADTLGKLNPIRYRGYFYDTETGFYFLKSRYYDPETCRFINADGLVSTGQGILGYNMYAYCNNNPVMYCDPSGNIAHWAILGIIAAAVVVAKNVITFCLNRSAKKVTTGRTSDPITKDDVIGILDNTDDDSLYSDLTDIREKVDGAGDNIDKTFDRKTMHSQNIVNAAYAQYCGGEFLVQNIDTGVFSSDQEYSAYCLSLAPTTAIYTSAVSWDTLVEQGLHEEFINNMPAIDKRYFEIAENDAWYVAIDIFV